MTHPDDTYPYKSREQLFETIRAQRIELDRKDDYIRKLESGFTRVEAGSWEADESVCDVPIPQPEYVETGYV